MMARKLSRIASCASLFLVAGAVSFTPRDIVAQTDLQVTQPTNVVENPYAAGQAQPPQRTVVEEPQTSHRPPITYQNPFAAMSKSPPVDTSLRPGPVSRWRRPVLPNDESSAIKSAILAPPPTEVAHGTWDELPPGDDLRHRAFSSSENNGLFYSQLAKSTGPIQFTAKPLSQPDWLNVDPMGDAPLGVDSLPLNSAVFNGPQSVLPLVEQSIALSSGIKDDLPGQITNAWAIDPSSVSPATSSPEPSIASIAADTSEGCFELAQHAATAANSAEELSAVIELCDRGLRCKTSERSSSLRRLSAWAHNRRGELTADAGSNDEALEDFQKAIALDAKCSLAIHNRAVTLAQQNQFAAALRDFNRVIELNPGLAVAYRNRAELLAALGRMDEAVSDYNQAIESLPNNGQLYRGRSYAYQRLGHFQKALADINRAIELSPNDPETLTQRGNLAAEQGDYDQAAESFRKAISINPESADAYRSLAWLAATCPNPHFQNPQQAITAAERAAKLSSADDYLILDTLAAARASAGQFRQAVGLQEKARQCAPPELVSSFEQRLALYRQGRAYRSESTSPAVRTVSHESPANSSPTEVESR